MAGCRCIPKHWLGRCFAPCQDRREREPAEGGCVAFAVRRQRSFTQRGETRALLQDSSPLPRTRKSLSELTSSVSKPDQDGASTLSSSRLLQLPAEIRICIWTHVLCGQAFAIRLLPCEEKQAEKEYSFRASSHPTQSGNFPTKHSAKRLPSFVLYKPCALRRVQPHHLLALPKTCRQIYAETVDLIYSANMFAISDLSVFFSFVRSIPLERLAAIRRLDIIYKQSEYGAPDFYRFPGTWVLFCRTLETAMPGLRHLSLQIKCSMLDAHWVEPLVRAKQLTSFDLSSTFGENILSLYHSRWGQSLPVRRQYILERAGSVKELQHRVRQDLGIKEDRVRPDFLL